MFADKLYDYDYFNIELILPPAAPPVPSPTTPLAAAPSTPSIPHPLSAAAGSASPSAATAALPAPTAAAASRCRALETSGMHLAPAVLRNLLLSFSERASSSNSSQQPPAYSASSMAHVSAPRLGPHLGLSLKLLDAGTGASPFAVAFRHTVFRRACDELAPLLADSPVLGLTLKQPTPDSDSDPHRDCAAVGVAFKELLPAMLHSLEYIHVLSGGLPGSCAVQVPTNCHL